jgi:large subunit ribosomal protein L14
MVQITSLLKVSDNSGARFVYCINVPKEAWRVGAGSGTVIKASVKKVLVKQNVKKSRVLKQGQLCQALIIRTVFGFRRWGIFYFNAMSNSVIVVNKQLLPLATRLFGPVYREIRGKKFFKIISKAEVSL